MSFTPKTPINRSEQDALGVLKHCNNQVNVNFILHKTELENSQSPSSCKEVMKGCKGGTLELSRTDSIQFMGSIRSSEPCLFGDRDDLKLAKLIQSPDSILYAVSRMFRAAERDHGMEVRMVIDRRTAAIQASG